MQVQRAGSTEDGRRGLLAGLVRCASCGSHLLVRSTRGGHRYYRCSAALATRYRAAVCKEKFIRAELLEEAVWKAVSDLGLGQEGNDES